MVSIHEGRLFMDLMQDALVCVRGDKHCSIALEEIKHRMRVAVRRGCAGMSLFAGLWEQLSDWQFHGAKEVTLTFE